VNKHAAYHAAVPAHPASTSTSGHNPDADGVRLSGGTPLVTDLSLEELEREARHAIGEMAYAYYAGGADDERLLEANVAAWGHWQLHPHVLAGVADVDTATTLLDTPVSSPYRGWPIPAARRPPPGAPLRSGRS